MQTTSKQHRTAKVIDKNNNNPPQPRSKALHENNSNNYIRKFTTWALKRESEESFKRQQIP